MWLLKYRKDCQAWEKQSNVSTPLEFQMASGEENFSVLGTSFQLQRVLWRTRRATRSVENFTHWGWLIEVQLDTWKVCKDIWTYSLNSTRVWRKESSLYMRKVNTHTSPSVWQTKYFFFLHNNLSGKGTECYYEPFLFSILKLTVPREVQWKSWGHRASIC